MKPRRIIFDGVFEKHWQKYLKGLAEKQKIICGNVSQFSKKMSLDKRLKTHRLKGNLKEYYAFSITYSDRIVFKIIEEDAVYFVEIGSHDVCY